MFFLFSPQYGTENHSCRMEGTYAGAAAVGAGSALDLKEINICMKEIMKSEKYMRMEEDAVNLVPPEKAVESKSDKTVVY